MSMNFEGFFSLFIGHKPLICEEYILIQVESSTSDI